MITTHKPPPNTKKAILTEKKPPTRDITAMQKALEREYSVVERNLELEKYCTDIACMVVSCAWHFVGWFEADVFTVQIPKEYPSEFIKRAVNRLQTLEASGFPDARENVLKALVALEPKYAELYLSWQTLASTWFSENVIDNQPSRYALPLFNVNDPDPIIQNEAKLTEQFWTYSGILIFLNRQCGYRLLDLEAKS